jgi:predicted TIM-barrel fold metal-dependent hydrolase
MTFLWLSDLDDRYGGCRAHNRGVAEFCADDPRLLGVGVVSLADTARAVAELDHAIGLGLQALWVPAEPCGGRSPGHDDLDPFWARLSEAGVPFVLHVGGSPVQIRSEYMNTGRAVPTDWLGGGENVRSKDIAVLHHASEEFLSAMVLDGVLERHPDLRGGVVELGAGWVPGMLRRLDSAVEIWSRSEPELRAFTRTPSEQIRQRPKVMIAAQPTWGVDVGAAAQIRGELLALRDNGCAVLVVSEELEELFEICDRLVVIAQGRVSPSLRTAEATIEQIGEWMSGLWLKDKSDAQA